MNASLNQSKPNHTSSIRRRPRRDCRSILERHAVRQHAPTVHAPGFLHGDFSFDEIRASGACAWFEQAVFIAESLSLTGRVLGWSAVRFDEGFVHVSTRVADGSAQDDAWLQAQSVAARTCVHLTVSSLRDAFPQTPVLDGTSDESIHMRCDSQHLFALEAHHLGVTRDHDVSYLSHSSSVALETMLHNHGLSLLGLCFKLMELPSDLGHVAQAA